MRQAALALLLAFGVLASLVSDVSARSGWREVTSSSYGEASKWDGGVWVDGQPTGYFGHEMSWYWHCAKRDASGEWPTHDWALLLRSSRGVAHQTQPLGSYVELVLPTPKGHTVTLILPITDRGPYSQWGSPAQANGGGYDIQETVIWSLGWASSSEFGLRAHLARPRPDLGRFCPRQEVRLPDHIGLWLEDWDYDQAAGGFASLEDAMAVLGWPTHR
jgi:hypothetical protein